MHHELPALPPAVSGEVHLPDGAVLRIVADIPHDAAGQRQLMLAAQLYVLGGHVDHPHGPYGGYVGESQGLKARAWVSYRYWVVAVNRILPVGLALLERTPGYDLHYRRYLEARIAMELSARLGRLQLLNSRTSAGAAGRHLSTAEVVDGEHLAELVAEHVWHRLFDGRCNPWTVPAANSREMAVRAVLRHGVLDTGELVDLVQSTGHPSRGQTLGFTLRRDLRVREQETPGTPRVRTLAHPLTGRRLYYPADQSPAQAIAAYDRRHPIRCRAGRPAAAVSPAALTGQVAPSI